MIQDYIKTGMVIYDDREKQHFRSECCEKPFIQYTDETHFPSFQLLTDSVIPEPPGIAWEIFDLRDNDLGLWAVGSPDIIYYHSSDGYQLVHDFRDVVAFPAFVDNETEYYLRLNINTEAGAEYWYSEAFKVCDCDVDGAGDGVDLITNGWFEDWSGVANPNNVPDGWTVANNVAWNYVADAGGECLLVSDDTSAINISQDILTIGEWYVFTINIREVTSGSVYLRNNIPGVIATFAAVGTYNVVFQAVDSVIQIIRTAICNIKFTDVRIEEFIGFVFCEKTTLNWWSDCDWDRIIYQDGYRNNLVLTETIENPRDDVNEKVPSERLGEKFVSDIVIKKTYRLKTRIPEYLWNALIRLPAYGSEMPNFQAWITLPDGSSCKMSEVAVLGDFDGCMNTFTIEFVDNDEYPVVATNCCNDEDVSEVIIPT